MTVGDVQFRLDEARQVRSLVNEWVRHAEGKTGVVLGFDVAIVGYVLTSLSSFRQALSYPPTWRSVGAFTAFALSVFTLLIALIYGICALFPRVRLPQGLPVSHSFYGSIGRMEFGRFRE